MNAADFSRLVGFLIIILVIGTTAYATDFSTFTCEDAIGVGLDPRDIGLDDCPGFTDDDTSTPAGSTPSEPSAGSPDDILGEDNAYNDNGTSTNGQSWDAMGGPAFTSHPFKQDDGTVIIQSLDGQIVVCDGSIFGSSNNRCTAPDGSYIEYDAATGKCYFYGVQAPDGKPAAGGMEIDCPQPTNNENETNGPAITITLGDAAPAPRAGLLLPRNISGCPLLDGPDGNPLPITFLGEARDVGQSADGTSLLVEIAVGTGAWIDVESCPQAF